MFSPDSDKFEVEKINDTRWIVRSKNGESLRIYQSSPSQWEIDEIGGRFQIAVASSLRKAISRAKVLLNDRVV